MKDITDKFFETEDRRFDHIYNGGERNYKPIDITQIGKSTVKEEYFELIKKFFIENEGKTYTLKKIIQEVGLKEINPAKKSKVMTRIKKELKEEGYRIIGVVGAGFKLEKAIERSKENDNR